MTNRASFTKGELDVSKVLIRITSADRPIENVGTSGAVKEELNV